MWLSLIRCIYLSKFSRWAFRIRGKRSSSCVNCYCNQVLFRTCAPYCHIVTIVLTATCFLASNYLHLYAIYWTCLGSCLQFECLKKSITKFLAGNQCQGNSNFWIGLVVERYRFSWLHLVQVVMAMYQSRDDTQRRQINAFMTAFQEHPQSWTRVFSSHALYRKFFWNFFIGPVSDKFLQVDTILETTQVGYVILKELWFRLRES